jgi:hypothetical protein
MIVGCDAAERFNYTVGSFSAERFKINMPSGQLIDIGPNPIYLGRGGWPSNANAQCPD